MNSSCGSDTSIVRGKVFLDGIDPDSTSGTLYVDFAHMNLGGGAGGGFSHINGWLSQGAADVGNGGQVSFEFDFCLGGEMWSEENGDYHIHAFVDLNNNGSADQGEPAGTKRITLSCNDSPHCEALPLNCVDGQSCFAITDTACQCANPGCSSPIKTCC
jgi:hypothetical protein